MRRLILKTADGTVYERDDSGNLRISNGDHVIIIEAADVDEVIDALLHERGPTDRTAP